MTNQEQQALREALARLILEAKRLYIVVELGTTPEDHEACSKWLQDAIVHAELALQTPRNDAREKAVEAVIQAAKDVRVTQWPMSDSLDPRLRNLCQAVDAYLNAIETGTGMNTNQGGESKC